jgi:hypothetical protein
MPEDFHLDEPILTLADIEYSTSASQEHCSLYLPPDCTDRRGLSPSLCFPQSKGYCPNFEGSHPGFVIFGRS